MIDRIAQFINSRRDSASLALGCIFAVGALCLLIMPLAGLPAGRDLQQHLQFAAAYAEALARGDFFPGWAASENEGFGSVGIRFYPPAPYYLLAATRFVTGSWFDAFWLNCFFWMWLGGSGVYCWARERFSAAEALFAGVLFAAVPYHLFQIFQALLFAEFAALGVLPFCFLFLERSIRTGGAARDLLGLSAFYSLLVLTHLPLTIIGSLALAVYALFLLERKTLLRTLARLALAGALSLAATAFYWIKIVTELPLVAHSKAEFAAGSFDYRQYLFPLYYSQGAPVWHFDAQILLALLMLAPAAAALALDRRRTSERKTLLAATAAGFFAVLMMSVPAAFVWERAAILRKVQFPWRWLSIAALMGAVVFPAAVRMLCEKFPRRKRVFVYLAMIVAASIVVFNLTQNILPSAPISRAAFARDYADFESNRGCECWWPAAARREAFAQTEKIDAGGRRAAIERWTAEARDFTIEAGAAGDVRLATFFYPHWRAEIDGRSVAAGAAPDGRLSIPVGAERAVVRLRFVEPFPVELARTVSLAAWLLFPLAFFFVRRRAANQSASLK